MIYNSGIQWEIGLTFNSFEKLLSSVAVVVTVYRGKYSKVTTLHRGQFQTGNGARYCIGEKWEEPGIYYSD